MASLCGFIVDHVRNVLHGDNYYTLDFEGTKTYLVDTIAKFDKFMNWAWIGVGIAAVGFIIWKFIDILFLK